MPKFIILVKYTDSLNRKGTARLQGKASDSGSARKKAAKELSELEKFRFYRFCIHRLDIIVGNLIFFLLNGLYDFELIPEL